MKRHDDELEQLEQERKKKGGHRKKVPRHDILTALKTSEENEYASGFGKKNFFVLLAYSNHKGETTTTTTTTTKLQSFLSLSFLFVVFFAYRVTGFIS